MMPRVLCAALLGVCIPSLAFAQQAPNADSTQRTPTKFGLPLAAARTWNLVTNEGTWMSVDVSPDGATIVFDLLGDLYTIPTAGGAATALTTGMAMDGQPRFSPDGKRVVYVSDEDGGDNLWTVELATKARTQVTKGKTNRYVSPEWTPDGQYLVASRSPYRGGTVKLWLYSKDGGGGTQIMPNPPNPAPGTAVAQSGAAFGADGRWIYFDERNGSWNYNAQFPQYQVIRYDRETGERENLTFRYGSGIRPTLSPDGKWLVYGSRFENKTGLMRRDLATGDERWLAYPVSRDDQESRAAMDVLPGMSFTPDSRHLVASYGGKLWKVAIDGSGQVEIPFTVSASIALGPQVKFDYPVSDSATFAAHQIRDAVPSPDGKRLAFVVLDKLYTMDWPSGTPKRVTTSALTEAEPAWSPDGQSLAWVSWGTDGGALWRLKLDGRSAPVRATRTNALYQQPTWSLDGQRIVAVRGAARAFSDSPDPRAPGSATELVWLPSGGGDATVVGPLLDRSHPHFSLRDTTRIFLSSRGNGLVSIRWDGTDEKKLVKVTGPLAPGSTNDADAAFGNVEDAPAEQAPTPPSADLTILSPAGDRALVVLDNDVYTVYFPQVGASAVAISVADPEKAAFPARKLTDIGGQFAAWGTGGHSVHWSIGNAFVSFDLDSSRVIDDRRAAEAKAREASGSKDTTGGTKAYEATERRVVVNVPRDIPRGTIVLRGARAVTMKGDEVIENADVVVRDNRIVSVGARGDVPAGAKVVDVSGKTIVPGFVDTHSHMWPAWGIHKTQPWIYLANLAFGVTTTRDPQTATTDVLTYGDLVESGAALGPRIYSTGPGVFWEEAIKSQEHARKVLKRYSSYYDTKTLKMYVAGNREQRQWIITAAREQRIMPTTEGSLDTRLNLSEVIDGYPGQEHSLPVTPLQKDWIGLYAFSGIAYTPTFIVNYGGPWGENYWYTHTPPYTDAKVQHFMPYEELAAKARRRVAQRPQDGTPGGWFMEEEYVFPQLAADAYKVQQAGGRIGIGSHGQFQGLGYHWEMWMYGMGGVPAHEVLRAATIKGAEAIGLAGDVGSLEPGKLADLVVLDANPLENIRNTNSVRFVMKNGRLYDGATLDETWPAQRTTPAVEGRPTLPSTNAGVKP